MPLCSHGRLEIESDGEIKHINITRVHLEEDTAKLYRLEDTVAGGMKVDFNRAGVPLLEIVSEPDLRSVEDVRAYATTLHDILVYLGINSGDMEKGVMRFEANVSVRPKGSDTLETRVEIKNLNSFRALTRSVAYEIQRQIEARRTGTAVIQQTMGWDEAEERTYPQRSKEYAHDYRYFPEPDIPPVNIAPAWIAEIQTQVPELPMAKRRRLVAEYDIRPYDAELLVGSSAIANYFEETARMGVDIQISPQDIANWITGELFRLLNEANADIRSTKVTPEHLVALLFLLQKGTINTTAAKRVLAEIFTTGEIPNRVVRRLKLSQISEEDVLCTIIDSVIEANPTQVAQYQNGKTSVLGWFVGQVMRASNGKANPQQARKLLQRTLE